jgi:hypothetical protein
MFAPAAASADADLFKDRCGKCRARATTLARGLKGDTTPAKTAALDAFLSQDEEQADKPSRKAALPRTEGVAVPHGSRA